MMLAILLAALVQAPLPMRTIDRGQQSGVDDARQVVLRSEAEWAGLWRVHGMDRETPPVDFSREMIVGVFLGSRSSAGFDLDITGMREEQGALVVQYREKRPAKGMMTAQVITSPYHLIAIPKRTGEVRFEKVE